MVNGVAFSDKTGRHQYPQCRLPSFASLTAAIGTGGYSEVSLRLMSVDPKSQPKHRTRQNISQGRGWPTASKYAGFSHQLFRGWPTASNCAVFNAHNTTTRWPRLRPKHSSGTHGYSEFSRRLMSIDPMSIDPSHNPDIAQSESGAPGSQRADFGGKGKAVPRGTAFLGDLL